MTVGINDGRKLSPELFRRLRDLIYEKSGIFFPENKLYLLEGRLGSRLSELGIDNFQDYFNHLKRLTVQAEELKKIYSLITINETYFFRYPKQLDVFSKTLFPNLVKDRTMASNRKVNIWSAASSSGEELFTLAMMIKETLGIGLGRWNISLKGTDISRRILDAASRAEYGRNSFRGTVSTYYKSKYFTATGDRFTVNDDVRKMVKFDFLNLNDINTIRQNRGLDFIFCRNVLIYFDKEMKKRVIRAFYDVLNHGGYLLLGEAESLHGVSSAFKVEHFPGAFVYKKE